MTLCPIALAVGCKNCFAFSACPLKGVIGDYKPQEQSQAEKKGDDASRQEKREKGG